ncbi:MAG: major capsid protein [Candidatus Methylomirabilales bacterium]
MPTLDVFKADGFSMTSLTKAIIETPFRPRRIAQLGLFSEMGVPTTSVMIESKSGQLSLIQSSPRGGVPDTIGGEKRTIRSFNVIHLARESRINADSIQGLRAFGSSSEMEAVQPVVNQRLTTLRNMHEVTLEHLRIGALKGLILDGDGSTVLYNLFTEFGVSQQTADFEFTSDTLDVRAACVGVIRQIEDVLGGASYEGIRCFCSSGWFDALVGHAEVKESFKYQEGIVLRSDLRNGFRFGGIDFEEYRGSVLKADGSGSVPFIDADCAYAFPVGVQLEQGDLFTTFFAPADFMETVNTIGLPLYAKMAFDEKYNRWVEIHSQSNPLPLCLIPRAVVKLTQS